MMVQKVTRLSDGTNENVAEARLENGIYGLESSAVFQLITYVINRCYCIHYACAVTDQMLLLTYALSCMRLQATSDRF